MSASQDVAAEIRGRISPTLASVSNAGLSAWLRTIGIQCPVAPSKAVLTELITSLIVREELAEAALEQVLIGFEEASGKRIYLFNLDGLPTAPVQDWLPARFNALSIPVSSVRQFAGKTTKPMTAVYGEINGNLIRVKWAEEQYHVTIDPKTNKVDLKPEEKRILLVADLKAQTAELRIDPPENRHAYEDFYGQMTAEAYYEAYKQRCKDVLGCELKQTALSDVIKTLVQEEDPRIVRIHIDHHTNQKNTKFKTTSSKADVRDDEDWKRNYQTTGASWAWDFQSFYWLPKPSAGSLKRELFSHIDATDGFLKVNADCSEEEVEYAVSQIRAR